MGQFLNNKEPYDKFKTVMNGTYFVDKSEILEELIPALQQEPVSYTHLDVYKRQVEWIGEEETPDDIDTVIKTLSSCIADYDV